MADGLLPSWSDMRTEDTARRVLEVTRDVALELHPEKSGRLRITLDSSLERELGLDSLGRVELVLRVERTFKVRLPETLLAEAATPRDLLAAVSAAAGVPSLLLSTEVREIAVGPAEAAPSAAKTLLEVLDWHADRYGDRTHVLLYTDEDREDPITYRALREAARAVAAGLFAHQLERAERVAIMLPTGRSFFEAFFGVLYAGGIPVPIYPPFRPAQIEEHLRRQAGILANAGAAVLIASPETRAVAALLRSQVPTLREVETVPALAARATGPPTPSFAADDTALLQYTSGSTGSPKGVVLTHGNLLANVRALGQVMGADSSDVFVSWLPLYHDMGLIGAWLGSLYHAVPVVILSPLRFLARPESWLWAIHRHRATISAAPNFAFELCVNKTEERDLEGLDLSTWRWAVNGAEPVSPSTIRRFTERFARYGFRPEAMAPVYGLAECSVGLSFPPPGRTPIIDRIRRDLLARRGEAISAQPDDPGATEFVACGRPIPGHQIRIVDATGHELPERQEGRLQFRGPSATRGYFRNDAKTRELFDGEWLESGDLAYIAEGDVYLTGRTKDIIIRAGRNIYPHEVEEAVGDVPGVRKGCVAVFGSPDPRSQTERIVVLAETRTRGAEALAALRSRIEEVSATILEAPPDEVVLAPPHTVLKTSSGKIRRAASRELFEQGRLGESPRAVWWQVVRLAAQGTAVWLRRAVQATAARSYAAYWWTTVAMAALVLWPLVVLLPDPSWRWRALRAGAKTLLALWLTRFRVEQAGYTAAGACIFVSNHASYVDGLVLAAALAEPVRFVAKRELAGQFFAGIFLRRIGALFVERADVGQGALDAQQAIAASRSGDRLLFFPEGTFRRMPGLLPFRMGAFLVAAEARVRVVPIALHGTRSLLRGDQWMPRRCALTVAFGPPVEPKGTDWSAAVELRDATRAALLQLSGEPDLSEESISFAESVGMVGSTG
jgi:1-acyl-sn-glycerol-3-phosphate acyltransferase